MGSLPTGTWVPLAPSRVGGGVRVSPFGFIFHHGFPPVQHATTAGLPRSGGCTLWQDIGHSLEKVAAADSGFPEVPLGVFGESPVGLVFPPPWFFLGFPAIGLHVACLPHLHSASCGVGTCMQCAAVGSRPFDRRLEPLFSSWLGSLQGFFCARLTLVFGTAFQESCGTRWRMSPSPRDRRTGSCWS